jgi:hypothetical protein
MTEERPLTGSCLCGGVRIRILGPFRSASCCHCRSCQKRTGSAFSAQGRVARENFELLEGHDLLKSYSPEEGRRARVFCVRCGSSLFSGDPLADEEVSVRLGMLDGDPGVRPEFHQCVASMAAWTTMPADGLRRFSGKAPAVGVLAG